MQVRAVLVVVVALAVVLAACGGDGEQAATAQGEDTEVVSDDGAEEASDDSGAQAPDEDAADPTDAAESDDATDAAEEAGDEAAAQPEPVVLELVATVAPVADLVAVVGGSRVSVTPLVPPGADSHTYEPRPSDVARLESADAYLGIGLSLNDAALRLAEEHLGARAPVVRLGELALGTDDLVLDHHDHSHGDDGHSHGDDGHSHGEDGHSHGEDGHSHGDGDGGLGPNPHVWTSLRNAEAIVDTIAQVLSELDPDGAAIYAANAQEYRAELAALDRRIADATATIPAANRTLLTYHDAWTYFARDYQLDFVAAIQPSDYAEPSAAEVRAVIDLIREREVAAVFGSEVFPDQVLEVIAAETGAVYVGQLADDVLPGEPGSPEHNYLELMRRNAVLIVEALGGDASLI